MVKGVHVRIVVVVGGCCQLIVGVSQREGGDAMDGRVRMASELVLLGCLYHAVVTILVFFNIMVSH